MTSGFPPFLSGARMQRIEEKGDTRVWGRIAPWLRRERLNVANLNPAIRRPSLPASLFLIFSSQCN